MTARSNPALPEGARDVAAPSGEGVEGLEAAQKVEGGLFVAAPFRKSRLDWQRLDEFGQIRIGDHPGRARQGAQQLEPAGEPDQPQATQADGAAGGAADVAFEAAQDVVLRRDGEEQEQPLPEPGMGEAPEVARDGIGLAVLLGELAPGALGGGDAEEGVEMGAEVAGAAAGGVGEVGEEGVPLLVGERGVRDDEARGRAGPGAAGADVGLAEDWGEEVAEGHPLL